MTPVETIPEGKVDAVCAEHKHRFSKAPRPSIRLIAGHGIEGDVHAGPFVKHRFLARRNPRAPNLRQVHLIAAELLQALQGAGHHVERGELGENITTAGIDLETLPLGTGTPDRRWDAAPDRIADAVVLIDRFQSGLKALLIVPRPQPQFRAGVMAIVTGGGIVVPGDDIRAILPQAPRRALPAI